MAIPADFVERLEFVHPKDAIAFLQRKERPRAGTRWILKNEVRPADLYCYLGARFGAPNGIQSFLRSNDSDNLIQWEWFLQYGDGFVAIQGMNFRTEIGVLGLGTWEEVEKDEFVQQLKKDFARNRVAMGKVRKSLEHWIEFVNPYQRLRRSISALNDELSSLDLDPKSDFVPDVCDMGGSAEFARKWKEQATKYSKAIGLSFGIRSMLPVMAEAFVNLLLYILMKPELKNDDRLRENAIRQQMDIRIKSLSNNCTGFKQHIDYTCDACKRYHTLVNKRNDLLHGNVVIEQLRFNELYFNGTVPVFIEYSSMWERSIGVAHRAVGMDSVNEELAIVDGLVQYLLSCLDDGIREKVKIMCDKFDLGLCMDDKRLGILFPDWLVDFVPVPEHPNGT